jgi:hypothetical protein
MLALDPHGLAHRLRLARDPTLLIGAATIGLFEDSASTNAALVEEFGTVTFEPERSIAEGDRLVLDRSSVEAHQQAKECVVGLATKLSQECPQIKHS